MNSIPVCWIRVQSQNQLCGSDNSRQSGCRRPFQLRCGDEKALPSTPRQAENRRSPFFLCSLCLRAGALDAGCSVQNRRGSVVTESAPSLRAGDPPFRFCGLPPSTSGLRQSVRRAGGACPRCPRFLSGITHEPLERTYYDKHHHSRTRQAGPRP